MAATLRALIGLAPAPARRPAARGLGLVPLVTLALFLVPVGLGLVGTLAPAFGFLPALGGERLSLAPWRRLFETPGLGTAVGLTLATGLAATALSLALALGFCAAWADGRVFRATRRALAPLLAVPHAALAVGLAFLLAPSGLLFRLVSPWATGWDRPPDLALPQSAALVAGLVVKETPFLLFMTLAALGQVRSEATLAVARSLGYGPVTAWLKAVLPQLYPQIRLPLYAVLAYALSAVDMALILGPTTPPPLAPLVLRWFADPDLARRFTAAAGACLQLGLVAGAILLWHGGERLAAVWGRRWLEAGGRGGQGRALRAASGAAAAALAAAALLGLLGLAVWSLAESWRFPRLLPAGWTWENWVRAGPHLAAPAWTSLAVGLVATAVALALVVGCLEHEQRAGIRPTGGALWLLYVPLLVPQIGFLFGVQVVLVTTGLDGGWVALVWSHLLFVLPYVFLVLADPWRALDPRYVQVAAGLGASPGRILLRVKLPLLLRPLLVAGAVGFAVSVAQYLPTLFAGAGRHASLTTEAVALAAGADRRVVAVTAFAQLALPLAGFAAALALPALLYRRRRGMGR